MVCVRAVCIQLNDNNGRNCVQRSNNRENDYCVTHGHGYVEHDVQGTPPHHGFRLLISVDVECACVEHYP